MIAHGVPGIDLRQEHDLPAPPAAVFVALTRDLDLWFPASLRLTGPAGRLSLLAEIGAVMLETGPQGAAIWAQVERIEPDRRLWLQGCFGVEGLVMGRVQFDLDPIPEGTRLTLTHQGIGPVPEDRVARQRLIWRETLGGALLRHLSGVVA